MARLQQEDELAKGGNRELSDGFASAAFGLAADRAARFGSSTADGLRADVVTAAATAGACRLRDAVMPLPVQLLPVGPVGLDGVQHGLQFGIQLDQSLSAAKIERKRLYYIGLANVTRCIERKNKNPNATFFFRFRFQHIT